MNHAHFLDRACEQALAGLQEGGIAAGAVLTKGDEEIAASRDRTIQLNDPIAVAEVDCIRRAGRRNDQASLTLYTTRCPDLLTAGTVLQFSIGAVVIGGQEADTPAIRLLREKSVPVSFQAHAGCDDIAASSERSHV